MAEKKWPMIGLEALGMSIEDIFIAVVDKTGARRPNEKAPRTRRATAERDIAGEIVEKTAEQIKRSENAPEETPAAEEISPAPAEQGKYYEDYTIKSDTFADDSKNTKDSGDR